MPTISAGSPKALNDSLGGPGVNPKAGGRLALNQERIKGNW